MGGIEIELFMLWVMINDLVKISWFNLIVIVWLIINVIIVLNLNDLLFSNKYFELYVGNSDVYVGIFGGGFNIFGIVFFSNIGFFYVYNIVGFNDGKIKVNLVFVFGYYYLFGDGSFVFYVNFIVILYVNIF